MDVPYKGGTENVIAAASGQVAFSFTGVPTALPLVNSEIEKNAKLLKAAGVKSE